MATLVRIRRQELGQPVAVEDPLLQGRRGQQERQLGVPAAMGTGTPQRMLGVAAALEAVVASRRMLGKATAVEDMQYEAAV